MTILILIFLSIVTYFYVSWGLFKIFQQYKADLSGYLILPFGYALSQVIFFPAYFVFSSALFATIFILSAASLINAVFIYRYTLKNKIQIAQILHFFKFPIIPSLLFIAVIVFAAVPYLNSGFGNYWQTANEDFIDALNGRDAFLKNELLSDHSLDISHRLRDQFSEQQLVKAGIAPLKEKGYFVERYSHDIGRLQYSSLAFLSVVLQIPKGVDVFFIQALFNLGLFAVGVYFCVKKIFIQSNSVAIASALLSSIGNFYISTYYNGHEGSLMYNSIAPYFLFCLLDLVDNKQKSYAWLIIPALLLLFIIGAYPYPLPYLLGPVVAYIVMKWYFTKSGVNGETYAAIMNFIKNPRLISWILILLLVLFAGAWVLFEPTRLKAINQFRSWGTMHNYVGFLQFWGLWPSGLANLDIPLDWFDKQIGIKIISIILSFILSFISIYGYLKLNRKILFLLIWMSFWLISFILMRFIVYDSYYIYKFIYINAWIIISCTILGFFSLFRVNKFYVKILVAIVFLIWVIVNLINNINIFYEIEKKSYNNNINSYNEINSVPKSIINSTFLDIPFNDQHDVVNQLLEKITYNIEVNKSNAKYLLNFKDSLDILSNYNSPIIWHSSLMEIKVAPIHNLLEIATYWGPELEKNRVFRWVSDGRNGFFSLNIYRQNEQAKYLYICAESGPSVDFKIIDLKVSDADNRYVGSIGIGAYSCQTINIENFRAPFNFKHEEFGYEISAVEQRKLIYRIFHVGVVSDAALIWQQDNIKPIKDLTKVADNYSIILGSGWYPFETYGGNNFRWVNKNAELAIVSESIISGVLDFDVEPGPSAGVQPLIIEIQDVDKNILGQCNILGRTHCALTVGTNASGAQRLFITSNGNGFAVPRDPRNLNFRIFDIQWKAL